MNKRNWNEKPAGENPDPPPDSEPPAPPPPPAPLLPTTAKDADALRVSQLERMRTAAYEELVEAYADLRRNDSARAMVHVTKAIEILRGK